MCGIAGFTGLTKGPVKRDAVLFKMSEQLKNRGPDEEGVYLSDSMCLIHRRLVVIDPAGGKQPMTRCCRKGSFTLVYNGELYNTQELRRELVRLVGIAEPEADHALLERVADKLDEEELMGLTKLYRGKADRLLLPSVQLRYAPEEVPFSSDEPFRI